MPRGRKPIGKGATVYAPLIILEPIENACRALSNNPE
jgi:hypothetical protein